LASELAVLQNGFAIRHERREILGTVTRLCTGNSYGDIPTAQIDHLRSRAANNLPVVLRSFN